MNQETGQHIPDKCLTEYADKLAQPVSSGASVVATSIFTPAEDTLVTRTVEDEIDELIRQEASYLKSDDVSDEVFFKRTRRMRELIAMRKALTTDAARVE